MKSFLISYNNNTLFMLVINMSRDNSALSVDVISQYDRHWFDNVILEAQMTIDEILLPIKAGDSSLTQDKMCFHLSPTDGTSVDSLSQAIEHTLVFYAYSKWCLKHGHIVDVDSYYANIKHLMLGVGCKFKRKNEK
ncbi:MAG: hypothetical protein RSB93_05815 [Rikenellaceae bacterium]